MLPDFTEQGILPEGVHRATFEEFERRFAYFDRTDRRFRLFDKLRELQRQSRNSGIVKQIVVGGSFVTNKPEPNDFDCIIVLDRAIYGRELRPLEYNVVSRRMARRLFGGDVFPVVEDSQYHHEFLRIFQLTRSGEPIGIVEIDL